MVTNNNGSVINSVTTMNPSPAYQEFITFKDGDGAIFHIRKTELRKLYFYMLNNAPINRDLEIIKTELDDFLEKDTGNVFM
jgi:hypothetical protein